MKETQALKGHLDVLLLAALEKGPGHGYAIKEELRQTSDGRFDLPTGTIYPALHRLENRGFLAAEWNASETGRDAKFYRLTPRGRAQLRKETAAWARLSEAIALILQKAQGGTQ